eukprot:3682781-Rhodomonas_salina.1
MRTRLEVLEQRASELAEACDAPTQPPNATAATRQTQGRIRPDHAPDELGPVLRGRGVAERGVPLAGEEALELVVGERGEGLAAFEVHLLAHHAADHLRAQATPKPWST